jgi:hypothetical protein
MHKKRRAEFDKAWKEILSLYFQDFMGFFFPQAHAQIVWEAGFQFLDKEIEQISRSAKVGSRRADKLVQVQTKEHGAVWVLMHIELQSTKDVTLAERMYIYNYKLFDQYKMNIASMAILGDTDSNWRPSEYRSDLLNCLLSLKFPTVKLADYLGREEDLEKDNNPFAIVVLAHLAAKNTSRNPEGRLANKLDIARRLYENGYNYSTVNHILIFLDWIVVLPEDMETQFREEIHKFEEELPVQHITSWERAAKAEGLEEGLQKGRQEGWQEGRQEGRQEGLVEGLKIALEFKFGKKGLELLPIIAQFKSAKEFSLFQNRLKKAQTMTELKKYYQ